MDKLKGSMTDVLRKELGSEFASKSFILLQTACLPFVLSACFCIGTECRRVESKESVASSLNHRRKTTISRFISGFSKAFKNYRSTTNRGRKMFSLALDGHPQSFLSLPTFLSVLLLSHYSWQAGKSGKRFIISRFLFC